MLSSVNPEEMRGGVPSRRVVVIDMVDDQWESEQARARVDVMLWRSSFAEVTEDMVGSCAALHNFKVSEYGGRLQLSATRASWISVDKEVQKEDARELQVASTTDVKAKAAFFVDARLAKPLSHWETQKVDESAPYVTRCTLTVTHVHTYQACPDCNRKRVDSILKDAGTCPDCHSKRQAISKSYSEVRLTADDHTMNGKCSHNCHHIKHM